MRTFRLSHKDPWVGTGRQRVSQTLSAARTSFLAGTLSLACLSTIHGLLKHPLVHPWGRLRRGTQEVPVRYLSMNLLHRPMHSISAHVPRIMPAKHLLRSRVS